MRRDSRHVPGRGPYRPSARRLNDADAELRRLANLSADKRGIELLRGPTGVHLRLRVPKHSIGVVNIGSATIPAHGLMELVAWHDDTQTWEARVPTSPGLLKIAANDASDLPQNAPGIGYVEGTQLVLCDADTTSGKWGCTQANSSTALSLPARTGLKIMALQSGNLWYCRFTISL